MSHTQTFIALIVLMSTIGWVITTWIRAKHGYPLENEFGGRVARDLDDPEAERAINLLSNENQRLTGQISRLEERITVLERIATDPADRIARDIDALR
ncbi:MULTISPECIES: hypothetical protein [unclassified Sphingomonas]|uniref:hypothetical protein n=1 Tax=unclassified Sphingomonas TaxID=196159 RepID=UPI000BCEE64C|nr:MAG: hypothetical protein B7Y98_06920 [Sphingomonas sp. 32-62-10]